jgi:hypothetical protein
MHDYEDTFSNQSPYEYHLPFQPSMERQSPPAMASIYRESPALAYSNASAPRPKALSKQQALSLARRLKRGLIVASIVGFGTLSGLAISHSVGVTASQTPATTPSQSPSAPSGTNNDDGNQGGYFGQQPQQQGGYGFGSNNSGSGQAPFSHSGVS